MEQRRAPAEAPHPNPPLAAPRGEGVRHQREGERSAASAPPRFAGREGVRLGARRTICTPPAERGEADGCGPAGEGSGVASKSCRRAYAGSSNQNVEPSPGALSTPIRPPCRSTIARHRKRPSAEPARAVALVARAHEAREQAAPSSSGARPGPPSRTSTRAPVGERASATGDRARAGARTSRRSRAGSGRPGRCARSKVAGTGAPGSKRKDLADVAAVEDVDRLGDGARGRRRVGAAETGRCRGA